MDDSELERKAVEELLKEANRAKARAETMGPAGWMKCPLGSTNKRFLLNTLRPSALPRPPGHQEASERRRDEHRYSRTCEKHHDKDCKKCSGSHKRDRHDSYSSKRRSLSHSRSSSHSVSRKSSRTRSRSRSPCRDTSPDLHKHSNRKK